MALDAFLNAEPIEVDNPQVGGRSELSICKSAETKMKSPVLLDLKGDGDLDAMSSRLEELTQAGKTVVFSFSASGRALALILPVANRS